MIKLATMRENRFLGFPTRSDTNQSCTSTEDGQKLEILDLGRRKLYYPNSENKGADQLRSCCEADLCLCFRIGKYMVFS